MTRAKTKQKPYVPQIVRENGLQEIWQSGRVELDVQLDPDNLRQKVTRLRVKEAYNSLKMITDDQKKCANRYALLVERADGATPDMLASISLCSVGRNNWEPTHAQLEAYEQLTKIKRSVGVYHTEILDLIIMKNMDCKQVAVHKSMSQYFIAGMVMSAFIKLEEAFEELGRYLK